MSSVIKVPVAPVQDPQQQPPYTLLSMETALLIATAAGREVDVNVWFKTSVNKGLMSAREFDSKIKGLATAMGIDQEEDVKRELELAVSQIALRMVHVICAAGNDRDGQPLVDLNYFFKLCQEKVDRYLNEIKESEGAWDAEHTATEDFRTWAEGEYDIAGNLIHPTAPQQPSSRDAQSVEDPDALKLKVEEYIEDSRKKADGERPKSAPSGKRAASRGESTEEVLLAASDKSSPAVPPPALPFSPMRDDVLVETKFTPASPYDEAVEFHDPHDHYDMRRLEPANQAASPAAATSTGNTYWNEQNRDLLMASGPKGSPKPTTDRIAELAKPRPSSAPKSRTERYLDNLKHLEVGPLRGRSAEKKDDDARGRSTSRGRRSSSGGPALRSRSETRMSRASVLALTPEQMLLVKKEVEAMVCEAVRQADLYHLIQVNLGFIDNYTMIPPRGAIVKSERKLWLSKRDLQVAFLAARLTFNEHQLLALRYLVDDFAAQYQTLYADKADAIIALPKDDDVAIADKATAAAAADGGAADALPPTALGKGDHVRSEWMKRYLVHLRLAKRLSLSTASLAYALRQSTAADATQQENRPPSNAADGGASGGGGGGGVAKDHAPMLWSEWLGRKLQREMSRPALPAELQRALQGEAHHLSKSEINGLLTPKSGITLLSETELAQELELRIESWVLDIDGRRDFQHALNVNIRKWIREHLLAARDKTTPPADEAGYWRLWEQLPEDERAQQRDVLLTKTVNEYRDKLETSESVHRALTKALYWQYDQYVRDNGGAGGPGRREPFHDWFVKTHTKKFRTRLDDFRAEEETRQSKMARQRQRRRAVAPLSVLLQNLEDVKYKTGIPLNAQQRREEMKAIVALRKLARTNHHLYAQLYHPKANANAAAANANAAASMDAATAAALDADNAAPAPTAAPATGAAAAATTTTVPAAVAVDDDDLHIVTKEEFDAHVRSVFAPYLPLNDSLLEREVADGGGAGGSGGVNGATKAKPPVSIASNKVTAQKLALFRRAWQEKINAVFSGDLSTAVTVAMEEHARRRAAQGKEFDKWLLEKRQAQLHAAQVAAQAKQQAALAEAQRKKAGAKAYRRWLRLRRQSKYKSMVDHKAHVVPEARVVQHSARWVSLETHGGAGHGGGSRREDSDVDSDGDGSVDAAGHSDDDEAVALTRRHHHRAGHSSGAGHGGRPSQRYAVRHDDDDEGDARRLRPAAAAAAPPSAPATRRSAATPTTTTTATSKRVTIDARATTKSPAAATAAAPQRKTRRDTSATPATAASKSATPTTTTPTPTAGGTKTPKLTRRVATPTAPPAATAAAATRPAAGRRR